MVCNSKHAEEVLKAIYPYLKRKRLQGEIALEYRKTYNSKRLKYTHVDGKFTNTVVPSEILDKRRALRDQIKILNSRGVIENAM